MRFRILFDGIEYPFSEISDVDNTDFNIRKSDEDKRLAYGFSSKIEMYGSLFTYVYNKLIDDLNGKNNRILVDVYDTCCGGDTAMGMLVFSGEINSTSLEWCIGECKISANILERSGDIEKVNCLKSARIYDNTYGFQQMKHPFIRHCTEMRPSFVQDMLILLTFYINFLILYMYGYVIFIITAILTVINAILAFINLLGANIDLIGDGDINVFDDVIDLLGEMNTRINGCKTGHPAPLVRDYIDNVCKVCGLTWQSSIFQNPESTYYNACWFEAAVTKGKNDYVTFIGDDKPAFVGEEFLKALGQIFNTDYHVQDGRLTIERRDYFVSADELIDVSNMVDENGKLRLDDNIISCCFSYTDKAPPAGARFEYVKDAVDWVGNEAKFLYNDLVSWNLPMGSYPNFKGLKEYKIPLSPARFRRDGIDRDVLSSWYDTLQSIGNIFSFIGIEFNFGHFLVQPEYDNALLLAQDKSSTSKILIWDGVDRENAKVVREPYGDGNFYYNIPMWVAAFNDSEESGVETSKVFKPNNLYDNFWYIDDPRRNDAMFRGYEFTLEIIRTCEFVRNIDFEKWVKFPFGWRGRIMEITIKRDTIVLKGRV